MIFEFVFAGLIFIGLIFFILVQLNSTTARYNETGIRAAMKMEAVRIAKMLVEGGPITLVDEKLVLNQTKIRQLEDYCNNNYAELLQDLELGWRGPHGFTQWRIGIQIQNRTGIENVCGIAGQITAKRLALLNNEPVMVIVSLS